MTLALRADALEFIPAGCRLTIGSTIWIGSCVAAYVSIFGEKPASFHRAQAFIELDAMAKYRRDTKRWKRDAVIAPFAHVDLPNRFAHCEKHRQTGRTANMMAKQRGFALP